MFPEGNVPGYVCNPGSPRERDAASQGHTSGIPTRAMLHSWKLAPAAHHVLLYFCINTDQTSASTKWEAFKAYIRGEIMSYTSRKSKEYYTKLGDLDQQIKELEIELIENNDP